MRPSPAPGITRSDVAHLAGQFRSEVQRWRFWTDCGDHNVAALPVTTDTREPFCPRCLVVFSDADSAIDPPAPPASVPWRCTGCGRRLADEERIGTEAGAVHITSGMSASGAPVPITCGSVQRAPLA